MTTEAITKQSQSPATTGLSRREVLKALRLSIVASMCGMFWFSAAFGVPLTMFLEALGASGLLIGLTMTSQQVMMGFQLLGAYWANRWQARRKVWFYTCLPQRILWVLVPLLPLLFRGQDARMAHLLSAIVAVSAILGNLSTAPWMSWMSDLVPARENGHFWGKRQALTTLSFIGASIMSGLLLDIPAPAGGLGPYTFFMIVYAVAALSGILDAVLHIRVPESPEADHIVQRPFWSTVRKLLDDRNFMLMTIAFGIWGIGIGVAGPFGMVYLRRVFQATYMQLSLLAITFSIGGVIAGFFWGRAMDTIGARSFGSLMLLSFPVFAIPWFFLSDRVYQLPWVGAVPEAVLILLPVNLLGGVFFSGVALCQLNLLTTMANTESRTIPQAFHFTVAGTLGALGPVIGGRIFDLEQLLAWPAMMLPRGIPFVPFHFQVIIHIVLVLLAAWFFRRTTPVVTDVPIRQLLGSPLRTFSIIQNLIAVTTPRNERERSKAIDSISHARIDHALPLLERALDDPATIVRKAAIQALGRMQAPAATAILLAYFERAPDPDLQPILATALGETGSAEAAPMLLKLLDSDDATRLAAIRALGQIGGDWARQPLLNILQYSKDPKIVEATGTALTHIIRRLADTTHEKLNSAARETAGANAEQAMRELLQTLDYPSTDIQQATIHALAGISDPAMIETVLRHLEKHDTQLKPRLAKALHGRDSNQAMDLLIQTLEDQDPAIQIEGARSIAEIGDRRALPALMEVLRTSTDERVIAASSDALVHLREIAAFYHIIPQMKTTRNPLLQRSLAVAAGNLLGKSGSFYSFLIQEENIPGSQVPRRLESITRRISRACGKTEKAAAQKLQAALAALDSDIENRRWPDAARRLFELSFGLAAASYREYASQEHKSFIEKLIWSDEHAGICTWFLYMITHDWNNPACGEPSELDVMLGLYFLSEWEGRKSPRSPGKP